MSIFNTSCIAFFLILYTFYLFFWGDGSITYTTTHERTNYYGTTLRGNSLQVNAYDAGILCALRQGVGSAVYAFRASTNSNGFLDLLRLVGVDIDANITRVNNVVTIDDGGITLVKW